MVPSLTPYDSPPNEGSICPQHTRMAIMSATGDPIHFMFGSRVGYSGIERRYLRFEQIQDGGRRYLG